MRPVIEALGLDPAQSVIDLGCGAGSWSLELAHRGHRVLAVDRRDDAIAWVRSEAARLRVGVDCHCADFRTITLKQKFGLVIQIFTGAESMQLLSRLVADDGLVLWRESYAPSESGVIAAGFRVECRFPTFHGLWALRRAPGWNGCSTTSCGAR